MPPMFLDAQGLADRLGVSYGTVLTWVPLGKIPCIRDGRGRYLFNLNSVFDALAEKTHKSNGHPARAPRRSDPTKDKTAKGIDPKN